MEKAEILLRKPPVIIFKFDDGRPGDITETRTLDKSMSYLASKGIRASVGVLSDSLPSMISNPGDYTEATALYKKWIADGHEMWLHGYDHCRRKIDDETYLYEFEESYDFQKNVIRDSCRLMKEYFGYEFITFGASWNRNNDDTVKLLNKEFPQFKTVLFGKTDKVGFNAFNLLYSDTSASIESKTGVVRTFESFLTKFEPLKYKPVLVLQGHPPYWDDASMEEFKKLVTHLENLGCEFMTPDEYRQMVEK